jgi:putative ABC transport system permease protein
VETLWQDLRVAARGFRKNPTFTLTAVLAIALGIGATTAVFSVVDRLLFRSLPYAKADRLVSVGLVAPIEPQEFMLGADYVKWRERQTPFESITSWTGIADCDLTDQNPLRLACARVESTFLSTLGVAPSLGRNFRRDEDRPNTSPVALLSHGLWQSRFGGEPRVIGRAISLDGRPTTVIGILPRDFELPNLSRPDLLVPQALDEAPQQGSGTGLVVRAFARLRPDVTVEQARAALRPLFDESLESVPAPFRAEVELSVRSLRDRQVQDVRLASWILLASVAAVMLIACANVANLLLARAVARQRELAIRATLGAGRGRLIRQQLAESLLLALLGGAAGCALGSALLRVFVAIAPEGIPRLQQATLDPRVLLFTLGVSLVSGLLFGLASSLRRPSVEVLVGTRVAGLAPGFLRRSLVAVQVAVSFVLLMGAGLLLRSLVNLQKTPLGMQAGGLVTARLSLGQHAYPEPAQQVQFFAALETRLKAIPGVTALAISDSVPPAGHTRSRLYASIEVEGRPRSPEGTGGMVTWRSVTPGYFAALRIPILRGRGFDEGDRQPSQNAVVISEALARRLFPGDEPLGQHLRFGFAGPWYSVVGVARDVKNAGLTVVGDPEYYLARKHSPDDAWHYSTAILRTGFPPPAVADWLRTEIAALDPTLPVSIETMSERVAHLRQRPMFNATLLGIFAGVGLLLAAIGVYGLLAFLVAERTAEFGVRMALGGTPGAILPLVLGNGMKLVGAGALAGLLASLAATRLLQSLLFEVTATDIATFAAVVLALGSAALLACYIPARRAMRVEPAVALRHQ